MSKYKLQDTPQETNLNNNDEENTQKSDKKPQTTNKYSFTSQPNHNVQQVQQNRQVITYQYQENQDPPSDQKRSQQQYNYSNDREKAENREIKNEVHQNNTKSHDTQQQDLMQYKVTNVKRFVLSDQQKEKAEYEVIQNPLSQVFNFDNSRIITEVGKMWLQSLAQILKQSSPNSEIDLDTAIHRIQFLYQRPELAKTDIDDVEQANLAHYIELCTLQDTEAYMRKDDQSMPEIKRRRLLGLGKDKNIPKEYGLKFMELLNKYGLNEESQLLKGLVSCLESLNKENISEKELFITFNIMVENIYEKACLEKKYITFYVKLLLQLTSYKTYLSNVSRHDNKNIRNVFKRFTIFTRDLYIKEKKNLKTLQCKKFDEEKQTKGYYNDQQIDTILEIYMKNTLTHTLIREEMAAGKPTSQRFKPKPDESPAERSQREINGQVHFQGCIQFIGELYKHDRENIILPGISNFLKMLIKQCYKELVDGDEEAMKEYPENKKDATEEQRNNYYKLVLDIFNKRFKIIQESGKKPAQTILNYTTELLKNIIDIYYHECTSNDTTTDNHDLQTWDLIQNVLKAYPRDQIEGYIKYRIDDFIIGYSAKSGKNNQRNNNKKYKENKTEEINIEVPTSVQFKFEDLLEEWRDTNLLSILQLQLRLNNQNDLQTNFSSYKDKIIDFASQVIKSNSAHMFFKEFVSFCKKIILDEGERKTFVVNILTALLKNSETLKSNTPTMKQTYKYVAHLYQESFADLTKHICDFQSKGIPDEKIVLYCQNVARFTVYISFTSTLTDQEDIEGDAKAKLIKLIEEFKFQDVADIQEVVDASVYEQVNYFHEKEAAAFKKHIPNLFDKNAIDSLAKVFKVKNVDMKTEGKYLKTLGKGENVLKSLCKFFDSINFGCGVQVFNKLKLIDEERVDNGQLTQYKLLVFNLEWLILNVSEQYNQGGQDKAKESIKNYIEHFTTVYKELFSDQAPKHIAACVMDKIFIYFKDEEKRYVDVLKQLMPILNITRVIEIFKKFQEKNRNFGSFKLLDTYLKSQESK